MTADPVMAACLDMLRGANERIRALEHALNNLLGEAPGTVAYARAAERADEVLAESCMAVLPERHHE